jgi:secondary thiamine-phosphate synthase enzyme
VAFASGMEEMEFDNGSAVDHRITPTPVIPQFFSRELSLDTVESCGFHDITDEVAAFVAECDLRAGIAVALSLHTTAGLLINEHETGFRNDFREVADRIVPSRHPYRHDDFDVRFENICPEDLEHPNGHSHLQHALFGTPSIVVPVRDAKLVLGKWQRVFLIEFDRPRPRQVALQAFGQSGDGRA